MGWLAAWWRQITGPHESDPWHEDPRILAERQGQHDRIEKAGKGEYYDQWNDRLRRSWEHQERQ